MQGRGVCDCLSAVSACVHAYSPPPPPQSQYKGTATCFVCTASVGAGPVDLTDLDPQPG